ncbi:MAG: hypothetical protein ACOY91_10760 [Pseudomonadota bacterium]
MTLRPPYKKTAITGVMDVTMPDAFDRSETNAAVKVVLFQGDGDRASPRARTSPSRFSVR